MDETLCRSVKHISFFCIALIPGFLPEKPLQFSCFRVALMKEAEAGLFSDRRPISYGACQEPFPEYKGHASASART